MCDPFSGLLTKKTADKAVKEIKRAFKPPAPPAEVDGPDDALEVAEKNELQAQQTRKKKKQGLAKNSGIGSTILTGPGGLTSDAATQRKTLLGS